MARCDCRRRREAPRLQLLRLYLSRVQYSTPEYATPSVLHGLGTVPARPPGATVRAPAPRDQALPLSVAHRYGAAAAVGRSASAGERQSHRGALTNKGTGWSSGLDAIVPRCLAGKVHGEFTYSCLVGRPDDRDGGGNTTLHTANLAARFGYELSERWFVSGKSHPGQAGWGSGQRRPSVARPHHTGDSHAVLN